MLNKILQWLLPASCVLCGDLTRNDLDLCTGCMHELPLLENNCYQCGLPLSSVDAQQANQCHDPEQQPVNLQAHIQSHDQQLRQYQHRCGNCLKNPPPYDRMIALYPYQQPIDGFITQLKFNGQLNYAFLLGKLLAKQIQNKSYNTTDAPECIIPIPLHYQRLRDRGFNQALEIARPIAKQLKIPILKNVCARQRATQSQSLIHASKRRHNLRNAFVITQSITANHIALIDDVVTTGSTAAELSAEFRKCGVKKIDIWCCARTVLKISLP